MMKQLKNILVVGNGTMYEENEKYYVNINTNIFLKNIKGEIIYTEITNPRQTATDINDSEIQGIPIVGVSKGDGIRALIKLWSVIKRVDYIHAFYPGKLGFLAILLSFVSGKPYGIYLRGEIGKGVYLNKLLLRFARKIITVSNGLIDDRYSHKLSVCHPMLSLGWQDYTYDTKDNYHKFLFVGRIEESKGIFEMLKFFRDYLENGDGKLVIVGEGPCLGELKEAVRSYGLTEKVTFKGLLTGIHLEREYRNADVFLFFSHSEGFPRVLYEATFYSCLVVTSDVGGVSTVFQNGINSLFISDSVLEEFRALTGDKKQAMIIQAREDVSLRLSTYSKNHSELISEMYI